MRGGVGGHVVHGGLFSPALPTDNMPKMSQVFRLNAGEAFPTYLLIPLPGGPARQACCTSSNSARPAILALR
jgi:hypothetical protein